MSKYKIDREKILNRLTSLSITAVTIQKTAKYLLQFYKSADSVVVIWYQAVCASSSSDQTKVALFYLANEVLQSKSQYGVSNFRHVWKAQFVQAVEEIRRSCHDDACIEKIKRIFNIWIERGVFDASFVEDLIRRLGNNVGSPLATEEEDTQAIIQNFDADEAIEKLSDLIKVESDVSETMKTVHDISSMNLDEMTTNIKKLKNKQKCQDFSDKLDSDITQLFKVCSMLEEELKVRQSTHKLMENAEIFYETQFTDTLIVEDAYRRYGNLITKTRQALEKHVDYLMDEDIPIDIEDAPSPGKTPPHLYKVEPPQQPKSASPEPPVAPISPSQSMDMSEDDDGGGGVIHDNKPYSPSQQSYKNLSDSDAALKLLTSVFKQSLTQKKSENPSSSSSLASQENKSQSNNDKNADESSGTNVNLNVSSSNQMDLMAAISMQNIGTSIPTLLSNSNITANFNMLQQQQQQQQSMFMSTANSAGNLMNPLLAGLNQPQNYLSLLANYQQQQQQIQVPPPPPPSLPPPQPPHPMQFNPTHMTNSPGSCTPEENDDDDQMGGETPTQDEPIQISGGSRSACNLFQASSGSLTSNQGPQSNVASLDPATALLAGLNTTPDELTKKIQDVISNPYAFSKIAAAASAASNLQAGSQISSMVAPPHQGMGLAPQPPSAGMVDPQIPGHTSYWGITNPFQFGFRFPVVGNNSQPTPNSQNFPTRPQNNNNCNNNNNYNNNYNNKNNNNYNNNNNMKNNYQHSNYIPNNGPSHKPPGYNRSHSHTYTPNVLISNRGVGSDSVDLDDEQNDDDKTAGDLDVRQNTVMDVDDEGDNKYKNNFILDEDNDDGNTDDNKEHDNASTGVEDSAASVEPNPPSLDVDNVITESAPAQKSENLDDEVHTLYDDVEEQLDKSLASFRAPRGRARFYYGHRGGGRMAPDRYHLYKGSPGGEGVRFPGGSRFHSGPRHPPPFHYRAPLHFAPHPRGGRFRHPHGNMQTRYRY